MQARADAAYLLWWNGEVDEALSRMRKLLADTGNNDVRLGLATMLAKTGKAGDAAEAAMQLREWQPPYPAARRFAQSWQLRLAADAGDAEGALDAEREMAWPAVGDRPICTASWSRWKKDSARKHSGCGERAWPVEVAAEQDVARLPRCCTISSKLVKVLARSRLRRRFSDRSGKAPDQANRGEFPDRSAALAVLEKFGARTDYAESLAQESAAAPDSVELRERLAETLSGEAAVDSLAPRDRVTAEPPAGLASPRGQSRARQRGATRGAGTHAGARSG